MEHEEDQKIINTGKAILFISLFATGTLLLFGPIYAYYFNKWYVANTDIAAKLGDWVGGVFGTLLSTLGAIAITIVTYNAFRQQVRANQLIQNESRQRQFEAVLFKYIDYHRDNQQRVLSSPRYFLTDLHATSPGVNDWYSLYFELKASINIARKICQQQKLDIKYQEILSLGYLAFFFGVTGSSENTLRKYISHLKEAGTEKFFQQLIVKYQFESKFGYFYGNQMKLSQYFRNLYRAYLFIDENKDLDCKAKKEYANLIRAQMSNHELAIFTLNCLSPLGRKWIDYNFINRYLIIKNVPTHFVPGLSSEQLKRFFPYITFDEDSESSQPNILSDMKIDDAVHQDVINTHLRVSHPSIKGNNPVKVFIVNYETRP